MLGDGQCDQVCNRVKFLFDFGDCGNVFPVIPGTKDQCALGCTLDMLGNGTCD